jgi:hypothetical protein
VIGMGIEAARPSAEFEFDFAEYSIQRQSITGNCFRYNRIAVKTSSSPAKITYLAFKVPANAYVYVGNPNRPLEPSATGRAFNAPAGAILYFGDYIFKENNTVEFRRDIDAARTSTKQLLPRAAVLELAESITAPGARMVLCTP